MAIQSFPYIFACRPLLHCVNCTGFDFVDLESMRWTNIFLNFATPLPKQREEAPASTQQLLDIMNNRVGMINPEEIRWNDILQFRQPFMPNLLEVYSVLSFYIQIAFYMNFTRDLSASMSPQVDDICFAYLNTNDIIKRVPPLWDENRPDWLNHAFSIIKLLHQYRYCIHLMYCEGTRTLNLYTGCAENTPSAYTPIFKR